VSKLTSMGGMLKTSFKVGSYLPSNWYSRHLLLLALVALLFGETTKADILQNSLTPRAGFDLGNIDSRSTDGPQFNFFNALASVTEAPFLQVGPFDPHPAGSVVRVVFAGNASSGDTEFGFLQGGVFIPLIPRSTPLGEIAIQQQLPGSSLLPALRRREGGVMQLFSATDSQNPESAPHFIARRIASPASVTIQPANLNNQAATFTVLAGDTVLYIEDTAAPSSDQDWNDFVVVLRQVDVSLPEFTLGGRVSRSDGMTSLSGAEVLLFSMAGVELDATLTNSSGNFAFPNLTSSNFRLEVLKPGFTFLDSPRELSIPGASVLNVNFIAGSEPSFAASGRVTLSDLTPIAGAAIQIQHSYAGLFATTSDTLGNYIFPALPQGSFQLTATKLGYLIAPVGSNPFSIVDQDLVNLNLVGSCADGYTRVGTSCISTNFPVELEASDGSSTAAVILTWSDSGFLTSCSILRAASPNGASIVLASNIAAPPFEDSSVQAGISYYYTVQCERVSGTIVLSNQDRGTRGVVPGDCDGDGVSDLQEAQDQTDQCDGGSFQPRLTSPAFTKYNTYLEQWAFLELLSAGTATVTGSATAFRLDGSMIATRPFSILSGQQLDLDIHSLVAVRDTYGVVRIDFNDTTPGVSLLGRMSQYRPEDPTAKSYSFAFTRELRNPTLGKTSATANSFDPQGRGLLVPNWLEIINLASSAKRFTHRIFDQDGRLVREFVLSVPALGEVDVAAGHNFGEGVYLNEILPEDPIAPYLAAVSRYSSNSPAGERATNYNYAFALDAKVGTGERQVIPITHRTGGCWSQNNWVEVVNTRESSVSATIRFKDSDGLQIATSAVVLAPRSQYHFQASALLPLGVSGYAEVTGDATSSLLTQSLVYFHDCSRNQVQSAYASPGRIAGGSRLMGSFNTFLEMSSQVNLLVLDQSISADIRTTTYDGVVREAQLNLNAGHSVGIQLRQDSPFLIPQNSYGSIVIQTSQPQALAGEVLRIRETPDERIDYVMQTPLQ